MTPLSTWGRRLVALPGASAFGSFLGLGTGVLTFLQTPSSANLAAALTDETGTGAAVFSSAIREKLTTNRTYYVRTDGSDSNTGLVDSAGGALLTIQAAWNKILTLDLAGFSATISIGAGTFTGGLSAPSAPVGGNVTVSGAGATTIISVTSANAIAVSCPTNLTVSNFEVRTTTAGSGLLALGGGARITLGAGMRFGACVNNHIYAQNGAYISAAPNYTIAGAAQTHAFIEGNANLVIGGGNTVTNSGTNNFSTAFIYAQTGATLATAATTFTGGTITGTRYVATLNSVINTFGGGASYFPGNVAGSTATGGQYA